MLTQESLVPSIKHRVQNVKQDLDKYVIKYLTNVQPLAKLFGQFISFCEDSDRSILNKRQLLLGSGRFQLDSG